jgi:hypothetical protein
MDDLIALGAPGPPARQERDVPIEALPADRAGSRLDLQGLGFNALLNAAPSHSALSIDKPFRSRKLDSRHLSGYIPPMRQV